MTVDILTDEYVTDANAELTTRECLNPDCSSVGTGEVSIKYAAKEVGDFSLAGAQEKFSVLQYLHYQCTACGVSARLHQ